MPRTKKGNPSKSRNFCRTPGTKPGNSAKSRLRNTWFFVRHLSPEELEKFAGTQVLREPLEFSGGKASVAVRSSDLGEGYVLVRIFAHFQGDGKPQDKILPQPASAWPLSPKGILELDLVHALQTGFKPMV